MKTFGSVFVNQNSVDKLRVPVRSQTKTQHQKLSV
jgi:hypothetical protein